MRHLGVLLAITGALLVATVAAGAVTWGEPFEISETLPDSALTEVGYPAGAFNDADGETLVVFLQKSDQTAGKRAVVGQRLSRAGAEVGSDFVIGADIKIPSSNYRPAVAADHENDRWLVVWTQGATGETDMDIRAQLVTGDGVPTGADDFQISNASNLGGFSPAVAYNPVADEYLVVWEYQGPGFSGAQSQLWAQRLDADGTPVGGEFKVSKADAFGQRFAQNASVAVTPAGDWLVVYSAQGLAPPAPASKTEIFMQRVSASATPVLTPEVRISETLTDDDDYGASTPDIAADSDGRALVAFYKTKSVDDGEYLYGQLVGADGAEIGNDIQLTTTRGVHPRLAVDPGAGFMMLFTPGDGEPWSQLIGTDGMPDGPSARVVSDAYASRGFLNFLAHDLVRMKAAPAQTGGAWLALFTMGGSDLYHLDEIHGAVSGGGAPDGTVTVPPGETPTVTPPAAPPATTPIPTPVPTAVATTVAPGPPTFASLVILPSARRCVSPRNFRIRLRRPGGAAVMKATVSVNGRRVKVVRGKRLTAPIVLRGLPKRRFTVQVVLSLRSGKPLTGSRKYRTCAPKRRR